MRHFYTVIVLAAALTCGCGKKQDQAESNQANPAASGKGQPEKPGPIATRVSDRPGNTDGRVFVAMYHHIGDSKDSMFRKADEFRSDLEQFDKLGFRPVTASDYLAGKMNLPPGASPVVMTFDDSNPDQIRFKDDGSLDPTCFLGIWDDFAKTHPEFPIRATFFVLPNTLFGQPKWRTKKLELIKSWGSEIANHTVSHPFLRKISEADVQKEIGEAADDLVELGRPDQAPLALPFGSSPKNKELLKGFDWHGKHVEPTGVFLVGSNPAPSILDPKFNRYAVPRIQANNVEYGLTYWLNLFEKGKVKVYVQP
jgi:peptidoglycan/xylan/chitin deacetylase (PgdA/CDA1 family)